MSLNRKVAGICECSTRLFSSIQMHTEVEKCGRKSLPKALPRGQTVKESLFNQFSCFLSLLQPLQMRAVSSPSLTENPTETSPSITSTSPKFSSKPEPNGHHSELADRNQTGEWVFSLSIHSRFLCFGKCAKCLDPLVPDYDNGQLIDQFSFALQGPRVFYKSSRRHFRISRVARRPYQ
jgi:hypothetical protein